MKKSASVGFFSAQTIKTDQVESEREETEVEGIEDWFVRQEEKVIILSWNYSGILTLATNYYITHKTFSC